MSEPVSLPTRSISTRSDCQLIALTFSASCRPASIIATMEPILSDMTVWRLLLLREYTKSTLTSAITSRVRSSEVSSTPEIRDLK